MIGWVDMTENVLLPFKASTTFFGKGLKMINGKLVPDADLNAESV
jgi:hypothetical protein